MVSKLACCSYDQIQLQPSMLAASILVLAVKLTVKSCSFLNFDKTQMHKFIKDLGKFNTDIKPSRIVEQT